MSKHTPGKLTVGLSGDLEGYALKADPTIAEGFLGAKVAWILAYTTKGRPDFPDEEKANADRLADCWNACEGLNPEAIRKVITTALRVVTAFQGAEGDESRDAIAALTTALTKATE